MDNRTNNTSKSGNCSAARAVARAVAFAAVFIVCLILTVFTAAKPALATGQEVPIQNQKPDGASEWVGASCPVYGWIDGDDVVLAGLLDPDFSGDLIIGDNSGNLEAYIYPGGLGSGEYYGETIQVTTIAGDAFLDQTTITSIKIPDYVTRIGVSAFRGCTALEEFTFNGEQLQFIPDECFKDCGELTSITIPSSVVEIGTSAFANCTKLTTARILSDDAHLRYIGRGAFENCSALKEITFPYTVNYILDRAFKGCSSLSSATFYLADISNLNRIGDEAFMGCSSLKEMELPFHYAGTDPDHNSLIGDHVFYGCTSLEKLGFRNIPRPTNDDPRQNDCFSQCTNLKFVIVVVDSFDDLTNYSFGLPVDATYLLVDYLGSGDNTTLEIWKIYTDANFGNSTPNGSVDLVIPKSFINYNFTKIKADAAHLSNTNAQFGLKSLSFEEGSQITEIGTRAFSTCGYLESVTIPPMVTTLGDSVFSNCSRLASVTFQTTNLFELPNSAFKQCLALKSVTLPEGLVQIDGHAFALCSSLETVYFPDSLSVVYDTAFERCAKMKEFRMPNVGIDKNGTEHPMSFVGNTYTDGRFWNGLMGNDGHIPTDLRFRVTAGSWFESQVLLQTPDIANRAVYDAVDIADGDDSTVVIAISSTNPVYHWGKSTPEFDQEHSTRWYHTMVYNQDFSIDYDRSDCSNAGPATVVLVGTGPKFTGERTVSFTIDPYDFSSTVRPRTGFPYCYWDNLSWKPDMTFVIPNFVLFDYPYQLTEDDVTISYGSNINAGESAGTVTVKAISGSNFSGSATFTFRIAPRDIADAAISPIPDQHYTGSEVTPNPRVVLTNRNGGDLVLAPTRQGRTGDYKLSYENNVDVGIATVTIEPDSNNPNVMGNARTVTFNIVPINLEDDEIDIDIDNQTYTGSAIEPEITIWYGDDELDLVRGTSYSVTWEDNVDVGTATATLTGIEPYATGTVSGTFGIDPKPVTVVPNDLGKAFGDKDPTLTATLDGIVAGQEDKVTYTLERAEGETVGKYTITSSGDEDQGNYEVSFGTGTFTISPASISTATVTAVDGVYNGEQHTPEPTVVWHNTLLDEDITLVEGTDYTVSYGENIHAGQGTVTVTGKGNFIGTASGTFTISPRPVTVTADSLGKTYADKDPNLTATPDDLIEGDSLTYTVTRVQGENVGVYTATPSGAEIQGDYTVTYAPGTFTISQADIANAVISPISDQTYAGQELNPALSISYTGTDFSVNLVSGTDYSATYSDNLTIGTASVAVAGTGNFTGTNSTTFAIVRKAVTVTAADCGKTYGDDDPETFEATVEGVVDEYLIDYSVTRAEGEDVVEGGYAITPAGDAEQGNYAVTYVEGTFTIAPANISQALVSADDMVFNGEGREPEPTVTWRSITLEEDKDYTVTSYANNVSVGQASVTVTGKGNFTGTSRGVFMVTPKPITVTADDLSKTYGDKDPALTAAAAEGDIVDEFEPACTFSREEGEDVGGYTIHVTGDKLQGNYSITFVDGTLTISSVDISRAAIGPIGDQTYAGQRLEPALSISFTGAALEEELEVGVDYEASYADNLNAGTATVTVTGAGNYAGETSVQFTIVPKPITVTADDYTITYGELDPRLTATTEGVVDEFEPAYDFSREEGDDVADYVIHVFGEELQGNYSITFIDGTLTVKPAKLTATYAGEQIAWDGTPELLVQVTGFVGNDGESTAADYAAPVITAPDKLEPGKSYELAPAGGSARNYTFAYVPGTLEVDLRPIDVADEPAAIEGLVYNGSPQVGVPAGTGFTVENGEQTDAGTYTATAAPSEGWCWADGTTEGREIAWSIAPADIAACPIADIPAQTYTGSPIKPSVRITFGDALLVEGTDFEVSYLDNTQVGAAGIAIVGKGNFTGSTAATFEIAPGSYVVTSAPEAPVRKGAGQAVTFTIERVGDEAGTFGFFTGVRINGTELSASQYEAHSGSVVITLNAGYVDSLPAGLYTMEAVFEDGSARAAFQIAEANPDDPDNPDNPDVPDAGDASMSAHAIALAGCAGAAFIAAGAAVRRKR